MSDPAPEPGSDPLPPARSLTERAYRGLEAEIALPPLPPGAAAADALIAYMEGVAHRAAARCAGKRPETTPG